MAGRSNPRFVDKESGWVERRFRSVEQRLEDLDEGKLSAVAGSAVTVTDLLTNPTGVVDYIDTDTTTATADAVDVTFTLSYVPIAGSLLVFQKDGQRLRSDAFTRAGNVVTILSAEVTIVTDDLFTAWYVRDATTETEAGGQQTLPVNGTDGDSGIELNSSGASVVASGALPPLADSDDATYIEHFTSAPLEYMVRIETLAGYSPGDPIALHLRLASVASDGTTFGTFLFLQDGHPTDTSGTYNVGQFSASWNTESDFAGADNTIHDVVLPFSPASGKTLDDCLAVLAGGDAWLDVNTVYVTDGGFDSVRIYDAYLTVG